jgi:alpha-tubulin suppressor-like RCC1 family protein
VSIGNGPHGCAIDSDGTPWCWGLNTDGQVTPLPILIVSEPVMIIVDPLK